MARTTRPFPYLPQATQAAKQGTELSRPGAPMPLPHAGIPAPGVADAGTTSIRAPMLPMIGSMETAGVAAPMTAIQQYDQGARDMRRAEMIRRDQRLLPGMAYARNDRGQEFTRLPGGPTMTRAPGAAEMLPMGPPSPSVPSISEVNAQLLEQRGQAMRYPMLADMEMGRANVEATRAGTATAKDDLATLRTENARLRTALQRYEGGEKKDEATTTRLDQGQQRIDLAKQNTGIRAATTQQAAEDRAAGRQQQQQQFEANQAARAEQNKWSNRRNLFSELMDLPQFAAADPRAVMAAVDILMPETTTTGPQAPVTNPAAPNAGFEPNANIGRTQAVLPQEAIAAGFKDNGDGTATDPSGRRVRNVRIEGQNLKADEDRPAPTTQPGMPLRT